MNSVSNVHSLNLPWHGKMIHISGLCSPWCLPDGFYEHQSEWPVVLCTKLGVHVTVCRGL